MKSKNYFYFRAYSGYQISLPLEFIIKFQLNEKKVVLYKIFSNDKEAISVGKIIKIRRKTRNEICYKLSIRKNALKELKLKLPKTVKIKILDIKKLGYKPKRIYFRNKVDLVPFLANNKFTCFELDGKKMLIYYLNNKASSVVILPRFIETNDFFFWNIGFYLAEGLKSNIHRVSASNDDPDLIENFLNYLKIFGFPNESLNFCIRVKPKYYNDKLKRFWSQRLDIPIKLIKMRKQFNKPSNSKIGNLEITVYNTVYGTMHSKIINSIVRKTSELKRTEALSILCGFEDGDGHVILHKGQIEIGITCEKEFSIFVKGLYSKLYDSPIVEPHSTSEKTDKILYRGINNALKFLQDGHFVKCVYKRERLIYLLNKMLSNPTTIKRLKIQSTDIKELILSKDEFKLEKGGFESDKRNPFDG